MDTPRIDSARIAEVVTADSPSDRHRAAREGLHGVGPGASPTARSRRSRTCSLDVPEHRDRDHRAVGVREEHVPPLLQPDERPRSPARSRRARSSSTAQDLYEPRRRSRRGARRIGMVFQKPNPFPKIDLRQRRLRPADRRRSSGELDDLVEESLRSAALWDEVKDRLKTSGARPLRRPAAAALHRARAGGGARGDPDGRAVLGARPDRDGADRGPDARAQGELHDRHRHAQHAAGRARLGHTRRSSASVVAEEGAPRGVLVEFDTTTKLFTTPADKRTEDYVTGRFG